MNIGYLNRRIVSMHYRLRIVSLASDSMNLYLKPRQGWDLYRINARVYSCEVKIRGRNSPTSAHGSSFSKRMRRVPYATKPFQTAINLRYYAQPRNLRIGGRQRSKKSELKAKGWSRRLNCRLTYFQRFDLKYLSLLRTPKIFQDTRKKYLITRSS